MPSCKEMKRYRQRVASNTTEFACPQCGTLLYPRDYERHCSSDHGLDCKLCCVWCLGEKSWNRGEKDSQADHMLRCWNDFMALLPLVSFPADRVPFDTTPTCPERNFFKYLRIRDSPTRAFEHFLLATLPVLPLTFTIDNLNLAVACMLLYLDTRDSTEWLHVMIRAAAFESFLEAMDGDEGRTRTLPFSCWCDGGVEKKAHHRQHRHLIVVTQKANEGRSFTKNVWKKINIPNRPGKNYPCKRYKRIAGPMHLVNTIGYLSQRKSRCSFSFEEESPRENQKHFYIFTSLPTDYRLALVTLWDGGLMQLLDREFRHIDPQKLLRCPLQFTGSRWRLRVRDMPGIRWNLSLPLSDHFVPTTDSTSFYLHTARGTKLYFRPAEQRPHAFAFLFYNVVGNELWTPARFQQKCLDNMKPLHDQNVNLKRKLESAERELQEMEILKEENENLRKRIRVLEDNNQKIGRTISKNREDNKQK